MNKQVILIVDDDIEYRGTLEEVIEDEGMYIVKTASDGAAALDILGRMGSRVNMVICDIEMPGMHGLRFLEKVGELRIDVPILMATSKHGMKDEFTVKATPQVKYFLTKPFDLDELLKLLPPISRIEPEGVAKRVVLLADEIGEDRRAYEAYLEEYGLVVKAKSDRILALEAIKRLHRSLDLVVFAFDMLGGNHETRMDFLKLVLEAAAGLPLVMLFTREEFKEFAEEQLRTRVADYLVKPFDLTQLLAVVERNRKS